MDHNELLFALQMRQLVIKDLEAAYPESMSGIRRQQFLTENFEGFLAAALDEVDDVARMIKNIREG
jgi:hypothetical protein